MSTTDLLLEIIPAHLLDLIIAVVFLLHRMGRLTRGTAIILRRTVTVVARNLLYLGLSRTITEDRHTPTVVRLR